jgi:cytidine deaminase
MATLADLTAEQRSALDEAEAILAKSYSPYSRFAVGACLVMEDGERISGANVENAAYGSAICAERSAAMRANAEGKRAFRGVAVIARGEDAPADAPAEETIAGPCGSCRQVLYEFAEIGGNDPWVVLASSDKSAIVLTTVRGLLPYGFGPRNLQLDVERYRR